MRRLTVCTGLAAAMLVPVAALADGASVADYLAEGYHIADKTEQISVLPGIAPYGDLPRRLLVTTYRLERGAEAVTCVLTYDSQRDALTGACE